MAYGRWTIASFSAMAMAVLIILAGGAWAANTWTVGPVGCDYTEIQTAINAAFAGDTIVVYGGGGT